MTENLKRAREHQKQRESLSITLPGFDTAMNTASKILNLTQDDLDEIMSLTDESFQVGVSFDFIKFVFCFSRQIQKRKMSIKTKKSDKKYRNY